MSTNSDRFSSEFLTQSSTSSIILRTLWHELVATPGSLSESSLRKRIQSSPFSNLLTKLWQATFCTCGREQIQPTKLRSGLTRIQPFRIVHRSRACPDSIKNTPRTVGGLLLVVLVLLATSTSICMYCTRDIEGTIPYARITRAIDDRGPVITASQREQNSLDLSRSRHHQSTITFT